MSSWIYCNSCFLSLCDDRNLAVTSCGHVICNVCIKRGKQGTCLICNTRCEISPLSDQSSLEVKALFADVSVMATKYLKEISKVVMFQAGHQRRLFSHYQQTKDKQKGVFVKMSQDMQHVTKRLNEQSAYIAELENSLHHQSYSLSTQVSSVPQMSHSSLAPRGHQSVLQMPRSSPRPLSRYSSTTNITENMEMDERNLFRKPNSVPKVSLVGTSQNGQMGIVPHRSANHDTLANLSVLSPGVSHFQRASMTPSPPFSQSSGLNSPIFKLPSSFRCSMSSLVFPHP